ncbi:uncharacterized protein F4807DRAFT_189069 [Annulohypoxylon truncatum]|uniref:uncharacterized protein n=1 Tax=Annulohypoxylon truncatum TaxID=327061 RepID=UPI0020084E4C|nr:uncharacterized protein F4807DRAFT_189069 [Annulohypoxylon truncatum]KAI1207149.1 hypothetical protein F4807DRAFT_189069 [Annulohypoxylon truncatum]
MWRTESADHSWCESHLQSSTSLVGVCQRAVREKFHHNQSRGPLHLPNAHQLGRRTPLGAGPLNRRFGSSYIPGAELPKVPVLRPTIWAIAATATIYIGCATYSVYREVRVVKQRGDYEEYVINSYDDLEYVRRRGDSSHRIPSRRQTTAAKWYPTEQLWTIFKGRTDADIMLLCAAALNLSLFGISPLAPGSVAPYLKHIPVSSPNKTLLTSAFGHSGAIHTTLSTVVLLQLASKTTRSRVFEGNGSHFAAFYLSTGIFTSLGHQLATLLPTRKYRFFRLTPARGASGVICAFLGAWATMNPNMRLSFLFLPGYSFHVQDFLAFMVILETYGLFIGLPYKSMPHAAHLSGLAIGSAYTYFDGKKNVWHPTCQSAFLLMKRLKMI